MKTLKADLGGHERREFLVRLPRGRYEQLSQIATENKTSLSYLVNRAVQEMLEGFKQERKGRLA